MAGSIADRWAAQSASALVFWLGGLLIWTIGHGGLNGMQNAAAAISQQPTAAQVAAVVAALALVGLSGLVVRLVTLPVLRLLEGYWPKPLAGVRRRLVARVARRAVREDLEWQALAGRVLPSDAIPDVRDADRFTVLDRRLRRRPSLPHRLMPTRLGNTLRAAESRPLDKYGLDGVVVWPRLWLVLPEAVRTELSAGRKALDDSASCLVWALILPAFGAWSLWAIPIGLSAAVAIHQLWLPRRAERFADALETAFDLHRTELYRALRWPLPRHPRDEHHQGRLLTRYLWRGSGSDTPLFVGEDSEASRPRAPGPPEPAAAPASSEPPSAARRDST
ncbi:hypothetical protein ABZ464_40730 [Streptomyces sp. NPDC005820]|uniref:hypothetical protein n=1 Tax=Streptomyces sp. NPDC005820 TaxID=3157069 RepID=UPI0033C5CF88